jgi:glycosyltransferase involved in cell wall biosynthesis
VRWRVLWLIKGLGIGGAERLLVSMAARIDHERFEIDAAYTLSEHGALASELRATGVRVACLRGRSTMDPRWVMNLGRLLDARRYDLIHTHSPVPAVVARLLASGDTRFVHTEHNTWPSYAPPTRWANAATFRRNTAVIAVSNAVGASIVPPAWVGGGRQPSVEILHHGVDLSAIVQGPKARHAARQRLGIADRTPVIAMVASFSERKDQAGLLTALAQVRRHVEDVVMLFIGQGPTEAAVRTTVARLALDGHVRFLGSRPDVLELFPALDVFVLNSRFEGLPIALLEAMASGIPAVVTRVGGTPEALTDGVEGRLVEPGDLDALASAITELLLDPERRSVMGATGAARVAAHFDIGAAAHRHQSLYEEVLE